MKRWMDPFHMVLVADLKVLKTDVSYFENLCRKHFPIQYFHLAILVTVVNYVMMTLFYKKFLYFL